METNMLYLFAVIVIGSLIGFAYSRNDGAVLANYNMLKKDDYVYVYDNGEYIPAHVVNKVRGSVSVKIIGDGHTRSFNKGRVYWKVPKDKIKK